VFLERDERTRGLEKTADGFFRLSIFFKTLPSFQNFGGKKILLQKRQVTRKQTKRNMTRTTTRKANGGGDTVKYSIIVPTYNEQLNIAMLLALIVEAMEEGTKRKEGRKISPSSSPSYEVIVVDDNSQDQTQQTIQKLQKIEKYRDVLRLKPRKGKLGLGSAYIHGLQFARGEFVILMDADLSHNPKAIPEFIRKQEEGDYDVVTGTRYLASSSSSLSISSRITNSSSSTKSSRKSKIKEQECGVYGWDTRRKLTSRVANYLAHVLLNPGVSDLTGSFRLYRKTTFQALVSSMQSVGYVFQMEIIVRAKRGGFKVAEVPISFVDRVYGSSKLGASEIIGYLKGLVSLFMRV
jgi:dolichol-phosphate mannosyltransferase